MTEDVDIANLSAKECIRRHFLSFGSADSFASERINFAKDAPDTDPKEAYATLPERSVHLHDMKLAWYNDRRLNNPSSDYAIRYMCDAWQQEIVKDTVTPSVTPRFNMQDWFHENDDAIARKKEDNMNRRHRSKQLFNLSDIIRWDDVHRVTMEIQHIKKPKHMSYTFIIDWLKSWSAMERFEKYILQKDKIWDTSRESLETLLILNLNMRLDPQHTTLVLHNYTNEYMGHHNGKFLLGQLRLNIVNPYACKLYEMKTLQLRFDKILHLAELTRDEDDNYLTYMPGSYSPNVADFIESRLESKRYTDNPINIGIDWFCYWLQPLLFDIDKSNANNDASVSQIIEATTPFMTWCGATMGYCLDVDKAKLDPKRKPLQLHLWPMGKPILYHACEKGSLLMLKFCVHGMTKAATTKKVDTPRRQVKVGAKYNKYVIENYPINTAAFYGHLHTVHCLLTECNASINVLNIWEENPYRSAEWAWRETAISDPVRSENCFDCMNLISMYRRELIESIDDTYREEARRQLQIEFKLALSSCMDDQEKTAYILVHPVLLRISKEYTLFIIVRNQMNSFYLQSVHDNTELRYFDSLTALAKDIETRFPDPAPAHK